MESEIVIRPAREQDRLARAELVQKGVTTYDMDAIIYFIFQEATLQACVLSGAVLFIFCGARLAACALLAPALAALVALGVLVAHRAAGRRQAARLRLEEAGFVAEYRGAPGAGGALLVGTASLARCRGAQHSAWLQALAVEARWRRRGVGRALLGACAAHAAAAGRASLEAATSVLQDAARALLLAAGYELRGTYHRRVAGAALTLPMARLGLALPHV